MESLQKTNDEVVPFMLDFSKAAYYQEINWGHWMHLVAFYIISDKVEI